MLGHQLWLWTVAQKESLMGKDSRQMQELLQKVKKQLKSPQRAAGQRQHCWQQQSQSHQMREVLVLEVRPRMQVDLQIPQCLKAAELLGGCLWGSELASQKDLWQGCQASASYPLPPQTFCPFVSEINQIVSPHELKFCTYWRCRAEEFHLQQLQDRLTCMNLTCPQNLICQKFDLSKVQLSCS